MSVDSRLRRASLALALAVVCVAGGAHPAAGQTIEAAALALTVASAAPDVAAVAQQEPPKQEPPKKEPPKQEPPKQQPPKQAGAETPTEQVVSLTRSPEHTGFKALMRDTWGDFKALPSKDSAICLGLGGGMALAVSPMDDTLNQAIQDSGIPEGFWLPGKYIGLGEVQIGAAIGTWAIGHWKDPQGWLAHVGLDLLRAQILTQTMTYGLKYTVQRDRPDGTGYSFPSGHASTTFASATVLARHLGAKAAVPTYAIATYVAASRLYEDRHYLSDVVFGATVGLIAGRTVTRHGRHNYSMIPMVVPGGMGVAITRVGS